MAVDLEGRPLQVLITPGQQHDSTVAEELIDYVHAPAVLADKAYDADRILNELKQRGIRPVIPSNASRNTKRRHDKELYKQRYIVECFFHTIKRWRRIATRYEKTAASYLGFLHLVCALAWI